VTGWLWDADGRWYHFADDGTMDSGWLKDSDGSWYYLSQAHDGSFGSLVSGWLHDAGFWYYLSEAHDGSFGRMLTGWVRVGGFWYYLYPQVGGPQGSCALDTVIDGYRVDASGRWVA
jgi:glucan-binding YG repeat protein